MLGIKENKGAPRTIIDNDQNVRQAIMMARIARAAATFVPHHVTRQGGRQRQKFFNDEDESVAPVFQSKTGV